MAKCAECTYLKVNGDTKNGQFWCEYKCDWKFANELECYRYCKAYDRSSSVADSAINYSIESQKSTTACYITTTLCKILSMEDDNIFLTVLRGFRKNYLQKSEEGLKILLQYDGVGPKISKSLQEDNGRFNMAYILFNNYIVRVVDYIAEEKYNEAISLYTEMTNKLISFYGIDDTVDVTVDEIEPELSGHGILVKKKPIMA